MLAFNLQSNIWGYFSVGLQILEDIHALRSKFLVNKM
jgi:hypothetical protein